MGLDKSNITSIITLLFLMVAGYFGLNDLIKNYLVSLAGPLAGIIVWYYTEKHNSNLVSGNQCNCKMNCKEDIEEQVGLKLEDEFYDQ